MSKIELVAPCHFGLEAVLKKEILDLGYEIVRVEDGRPLPVMKMPSAERIFFCGLQSGSC